MVEKFRLKFSKNVKIKDNITISKNENYLDGLDSDKSLNFSLQ